jgi:hypothetical protein
VAFLQCFPKLQNLAISWSRFGKFRGVGPPSRSLIPTPGPVTGLRYLHRLQILLHSNSTSDHTTIAYARALFELLSLFDHLPLSRLRHLGVFFEDFLNSESTLQSITALVAAMGRMRFPRLDSFHLNFNYEVFDLPALNLWVRSLSCVHRAMC